MKKITTSVLAATFFCLCLTNSKAQNAPVWTQTISSPADTAMTFPVKTLNDNSNNVYVLSTYYKNPGAINKIYLNKYTSAGTLLWSLIYDNSGSGNPRGFDLGVDNADNCYIAGSFMSPTNYKPLLLKVSPSGSVVWMRDSTNSFSTSFYDQLILKNNLLYLSSGSGVAVFDLNGTEQWSDAVLSQRITVDNAGRMVASGYFSGSINLYGYDASGNLSFSDSTIYARKMASDYDDSFYLLTDYGSSGYELVKYDSSGIFQWTSTAFPSPPPSFGDIGLDVLVDYNNDVIVVGVNDTIVKLSPSGNIIWSKPMNGLDSHVLSAKITFSNLIAVAGTVNGPNGYDMAVSLFDLNGNQNWQGYYDGNTAGQEFTVDVTIDNSGIYVIEDSSSNTKLVKFGSPFLSAVDYSLVCVDGVWYDTLNPVFINVRIFNGDVNSLNYPSVQIVSPANDTIGNPSNWVTFFAHLGNSYQIYSDTITQTGITDFSSYTFLISEGFGDTTAVISWCGPDGIREFPETEFLIFPNPAENQLTVGNKQLAIKSIEVFDISGRRQYIMTLAGGTKASSIDISELESGIYFLRMKTEKGIATAKFVKQ